MLRRFAVRNRRSFREESVLDMQAHHYREHPSHIRRSIIPDSGILGLAAIFGPNASGKSNLVDAMRFARELIVADGAGEESAFEGPLIPVKLFRTHRKNRESCVCGEGRETRENRSREPYFGRYRYRPDGITSEYEFEIECKGGVYRYRFKLTWDEIPSEQLWKIGPDGELLVYKRWNVHGKGRALPGRFHFREAGDIPGLHAIANSTRPDQLLLNQLQKSLLSMEMNIFPARRRFRAPKSALKALMEVYQWFEKTLLIVPDTGNHTSLRIPRNEVAPFLRYMSSMMRKAGTGVYGIKEIAKGDASARLRLHDLATVYQREKEDAICFRFEEESDGIRRFIHLATLLYRLARENIVCLLDGLEQALHPHLTRFFLETYLAQSKGGETNNGKSQLIFTTHETCLLDQDLLRRDEIWFTEKNPKKGSSRLYSLRELGVRNDLRLDSAYLQGRLGAVPVRPA